MSEISIIDYMKMSEFDRSVYRVDNPCPMCGEMVCTEGEVDLAQPKIMQEALEACEAFMETDNE